MAAKCLLSFVNECATIFRSFPSEFPTFSSMLLLKKLNCSSRSATHLGCSVNRAIDGRN